MSERLRILELAVNTAPAGADEIAIIRRAEAFADFVEGKPPLVDVPAKEPRAKSGEGPLTRFKHNAMKDPKDLRTVSSDAPDEARTLFPSTVVSPAASPSVLVSGEHNRKLGKIVQKGDWAGMPIFQLSLEERATCPEDCFLWSDCYGNAMGMARRHSTDGLEEVLAKEIKTLALTHANGFVIRLHTLGDFYSEAYVAFWELMLHDVPQLRVFGYTARKRDSKIGKRIKAITDRSWDRFAIRFSDAESKPQGATTIDRLPEGSVVPEGQVCPAETGDTACCATCGLCWSKNAKAKTIVFVKHGVTIEKPKGEAGLTKREQDCYRAIERHIASGEAFTQTDIADDMGVDKASLAPFIKGLKTKGYIRITGRNPATYTLLKRIDGTEKAHTESPRPEKANKADNVHQCPSVDTAPPKRGPKIHKIRRPSHWDRKPVKPVTNDPPIDESKVRRFEPGQMSELVMTALREKGYEVRFNYGTQVYTIDGKTYSADKAIELADEIRTSNGLEPLGVSA